MTYTTLSQALGALSSVAATQDGITAFVRQLSVEASGSTTVLYSGSVGGTPAWRFVGDMGDDVRHIGKTLAAEVLNSDAFKAKVAQVYGLTLDQFDAILRQPTVDHPAKTWLNKGGTGPWATASEMFVNGTTTSIRFIAIDPLADSVLVKNEWKVALERLRTGQISSLEGLSAADLNGLSQSQALETMKAKSMLHVGMSGMKATPDGLRSLGDFLNPQVLDDASYAKNNPAAMQKFTDFFKSIPLSDSAKDNLRISAKGLGPTLAVLVLGIALSTSAQAAESGNPDKARKIMESWALEAAGGTAGAAIGTTLVAIAAGAAVLAGATVSAPVLAALAIGAAIVGGIYGGDAAIAAWEKYRGSGDNDELNILEKLLAKVALRDYGLVFGTKGADLLEGSSKADYIFGGAGDDTLKGLQANDVLRAGAGNDMLDGGEGDDKLIGGDGNDTYQFSGLFGNDSITDSDGLGNITINGVQIAGLTQVQDNVWENASKTLVFTQVTAAAASAASGGQAITNLIIGQRTAPGSGAVNATITVQGFKDGNLGINLGTETKKVENNGFVVADRKSKGDEASFFGDSQYWIRSDKSAGPEITLDAGKGNDLIGGNTQAETITGAGHDWIAGGGGKDVLLGGDGYDWIIADIKAKPNGGLDENGQLVDPPAGYNNAGIYFDTGDGKFQGYGWALYTKLDTTGSKTYLGQTRGPTDGIVQSGDTSDVFIDGGAGTPSSKPASTSHLEIDSKLLRFLPGYLPISIKKQTKKSCKSSLRDKFRTKTAGSRSEYSIVCYGSRSDSHLRCQYCSFRCFYYIIRSTSKRGAIWLERKRCWAQEQDSVII